jgi:hypothetical protein
VLSDPEKRAQFDRERLAPSAPPAAEGTTAASNTSAYSEEKTTPRTQKQPDPAQRADAADKNSEGRSLKLTQWLWGQLKLILSILILVIFFFFWSLVTGQVNNAAILVLVLSALYVILSVVIKIRKVVI